MASPLARRLLLAPVSAPPPCRQSPLNKSVLIAFVGALCAAFIYLLIPTIYQCFLNNRRPLQGSSDEEKWPVVSERELREIPVATYGSSTCRAGEASCSVCLDDYAEGDEVRVLPRCGHVFHRECIDRWLATRSQLCPVCRGCVIERKAAVTTAGFPDAGLTSIAHSRYNPA